MTRPHVGRPVDKARRPVAVGVSTGAELVARETDSVATVAADVATCATAASEVAEAVIVVVTVCSEIIDPVTVAVGGTVTVAVRVAGVEEADAVEAAELQVSFWVEHSSKENPAPVKETQVVN